MLTVHEQSRNLYSATIVVLISLYLTIREYPNKWWIIHLKSVYACFTIYTYLLTPETSFYQPHNLN